eukprot:767876-Hanusia_phi.AAC.10
MGGFSWQRCLHLQQHNHDEELKQGCSLLYRNALEGKALGKARWKVKERNEDKEGKGEGEGEQTRSLKITSYSHRSFACGKSNRGNKPHVYSRISTEPATHLSIHSQSLSS